MKNKFTLLIIFIVIPIMLLLVIIPFKQSNFNYNKSNYIPLVSTSNNSSFDLIWDFEKENYIADLAIDSLNNIYITGAVFVDSIREFRTLIVKCDPNGNILWYQYYNPSNFDWLSCKSIIIDSSNNFYLGGLVEGIEGILDEQDVGLIKFDPNGTELWTRRWNMTNFDQCRDFEIDSSDNIYITGFFVGGEVFLIKYNVSGSLLWNKTWSPENIHLICGNSVAVDSEHNIYITGHYDLFAPYYISFLLKYNESGILQWNRTWTIPYMNDAQKIAIDFLNNIIYMDHFSIIQFNSSGNVIWNKTLHEWEDYTGPLVYNWYPITLKCDSLNSIYVTRSIEDSTIYKIPEYVDEGLTYVRLEVYNISGDLIRKVRCTGCYVSRCYGFDFDSDLNLYLVGVTTSRNYGTYDWTDLFFMKNPEDFTGRCTFLSNPLNLHLIIIIIGIISFISITIVVLKRKGSKL